MLGATLGSEPYRNPAAIRASVERSEKGLPDGDQYLTDDLVCFVLTVSYGAENLSGGSAVIDELLKRFGRAHESSCMSFEHAEEVALLREQPLKPGKHAYEAPAVSISSLRRQGPRSQQQSPVEPS